MNTKYYNKEWEDKIIQACDNVPSMAHACASIQMNHNTFARHAKRLGVYHPNQAGIGIRKNMPKILLTDIIDKGKQPQYDTSNLRVRLLKEGVKDHICESCKRRTWLKQPISLELHHKDGNRANHTRNNLLLLCPNCHSFTNNYGSRNKKSLKN